MFTPVTDTGARIEYIDNWTGNINGVKEHVRKYLSELDK